MIEFYTYCGLAGDLDGMLVGVSSDGTRFHELYRCCGIFSLWSLRRARRRIMRQYEMLFGTPPVIEKA